jgi:hypothetical protein
MLEQLNELIKKIAEQNDSDLFLFCGTISDRTVDEFIAKLRDKHSKRANCSLLLTTYGGDPDAGYRLVRAIKRYYTDFILYVYGSCKSTGTLIALGANKIIMSDYGEFGPLDIQLAKDDELSNTSGLSYLQSLTSLNEQIFRSFESSFLNLKRKSGFTITTRTAAEIGSKLAIGLISPISAQLDPVKLGEVQRAIKIADAYGRRLCDDTSIVSRLIAGYPSHGFVIDYEEASKIFPNVRFVNQPEASLERMLFHLVRAENDEPTISDLLEFVAEQEQAEKEKEKEQQKQQEAEKNIDLPTENVAELQNNKQNSNGSNKRNKSKAEEAK